jgi:3-oxoacyl-[acyl-carrier-protein] synthase III
MLQIVRNVKIIGTGSYIPEKIFTNKYLETIIETSDEWIYNTLGIRERHIAAPDESTSDLASKAALHAIENAGLKPGDIDLIIIATTTPDRIAPSTACIVQEKIKAFNAAAFDLSAVCSGFLYSMSVATQFISANTYDNVLIIGADTFSKITDWTRRDCVFFGDGAGAAVLTHAKDNEGFIATKLFADGRGKHAWTVPAGGSEMPASHNTVDQRLHFYQMDGKFVYDTAVTVLPYAIKEVLKKAKIKISDIDYIIPHQPSIGILKETAKILGIPFSKVLTNMDKYANTSGGTIPILLDEANRAGLLKKDNIIVFAAVGSGWTWGAIAMRWV